jgi:hypothetical protein
MFIICEISHQVYGSINVHRQGSGSVQEYAHTLQCKV